MNTIKVLLPEGLYGLRSREYTKLERTLHDGNSTVRTIRVDNGEYVTENGSPNLTVRDMNHTWTATYSAICIPYKWMAIHLKDKSVAVYENISLNEVFATRFFDPNSSDYPVSVMTFDENSMPLVLWRDGKFLVEDEGTSS